MKTLVPSMMEDLCQLVVDPVCKPAKKMKPNQENRFELVYREENPWYGVTAVNLRRPFSIDSCYPFPELRPFIGKTATFKTKKSYKYKMYLKHGNSKPSANE